jgi:hypothetical protein
VAGAKMRAELTEDDFLASQRQTYAEPRQQLSSDRQAAIS